MHSKRRDEFVGPTRVRIADIGKPFDLGRHLGQPMKFGGGQQPAGRSDRRWQLGVGFGAGRQVRDGQILLLKKFVFNNKPARARSTVSAPVRSVQRPRRRGLPREVFMLLLNQPEQRMQPLHLGVIPGGLLPVCGNPLVEFYMFSRALRLHHAGK